MPVTMEHGAGDVEFLAFSKEVEDALPLESGEGLAEARADYLLERIAQEERRMARTTATAVARVQMIRSHEEEELRKSRNRIAYLEQLVRACLPGDAKRYKEVYGSKSVSLPHGRVGFRKSPLGVEVTNLAAALEFAHARGIETRINETVDKRILKEYLASTGEEPSESDGLRIVPEEEHFYITAVDRE